MVKLASAESWTVIDAVQSAISNHPQTLIAESLIEEARGEHRIALSLPPPKITARYDDIPLNSGLSNYQEYRIGVSQKFEFPLRYIWMKKTADRSVDLARNESQALSLDLESEIRQIYLEAWFSAEQEKILTVYRDSLKTYYSAIQEINKFGGISRLDTRRARVKAFEADNELRTSQYSKIAALDRLSRMTQYDLTGIELISPLEIDPVDTTSLDESKRFVTNPELSAARSNIDISASEKTLATTAWLPEIELTYFHRYEVDPENLDSWAFQLELAFPLWFWWGGFGEIQSSKAKFKRTKAELASYNLELASEYSKLLQEIKSVSEYYELFQSEILPLTIDEYQTVSRNVHLGTGGYIDLIDAQDELKDIQLENIEIIFELYERKIALDRFRGKSIIHDISK
jgi:outer membrane protein TolC